MIDNNEAMEGTPIISDPEQMKKLMTAIELRQVKLQELHKNQLMGLIDSSDADLLLSVIVRETYSAINEIGIPRNELDHFYVMQIMGGYLDHLDRIIMEQIAQALSQQGMN